MVEKDRDKQGNRLAMFTSRLTRIFHGIKCPSMMLGPSSSLFSLPPISQRSSAATMSSALGSSRSSTPSTTSFYFHILLVCQHSLGDPRGGRFKHLRYQGGTHRAQANKPLTNRDRIRSLTDLFHFQIVTQNIQRTGSSTRFTNTLLSAASLRFKQTTFFVLIPDKSSVQNDGGLKPFSEMFARCALQHRN